MQVLALLNQRLPLFGQRIESREDVMNAYLLLQVIEERALEQFSMVEPILRKYDAESADVLATIIRDEERHLKYCHAIVQKYAPDEATRIARLRKLRDAESEAFQEHQRGGLAHLVKSGYLSFFQSMFWSAFSKLGALRNVAPRTRFYQDFENQAAALA
jgi:hypothetical protein